MKNVDLPTMNVKWSNTADLRKRYLFIETGTMTTPMRGRAKVVACSQSFPSVYHSRYIC